MLTVQEPADPLEKPLRTRRWGPRADPGSGFIPPSSPGAGSNSPTSLGANPDAPSSLEATQSHSSSSSQSSGTALAEAIDAYLARREPTEADMACRRETFSRLQTLVREALGDDEVELHLFGSAGNRFGERGCDLDVAVELGAPWRVQEVLADKKIRERQILERGCVVAVGHEASNHGFEVVGRILSAHVPLLMLRETNVGLSCDLSFNNLKGVKNTKLLAAYASLDERLVKVVRIVKHWAKAAGVSGSKRGRLSSYAITLLVIFFFQVSGELPSLQAHVRDDDFLELEEDLSKWIIPNRSELDAAELLLHFFEFYLYRFRWDTQVVSVRLGEVRHVSDRDFIQLKHRRDKRSIHIEDPFELERNLNCVLAEDAAVEMKHEMEGALAWLRKGNLEYLFLFQCCWCTIQGFPASEGYEDEVTDLWYCRTCWESWQRTQRIAKASKMPKVEDDEKSIPEKQPPPPPPAPMADPKVKAETKSPIAVGASQGPGSRTALATAADEVATPPSSTTASDGGVKLKANKMPKSVDAIQPMPKSVDAIQPMPKSVDAIQPMPKSVDAVQPDLQRWPLLQSSAPAQASARRQRHIANAARGK